MIEVFHDFFFYINLIAVLLITFSCLKMAYTWKRWKFLFTNFFSLGMTYPLIFFFLSYWNATHNLFPLITGNILFFVWTILLSIGTFIIIFPRKSPFDYAPLAYVLIPFIYFFTRNIETTFIRTLDLTGFIILLTFIKLLLFGKKPIKIASIFGVAAGLVSIIYTVIVLVGLSLPIYSWLLNVFLAIAFCGFWYVSKNNPDYFLNSYELKEMSQ